MSDKLTNFRVLRTPASDSDSLVLIHHGIEGQKWGQQNGPPYPLDYEDHSAAEKKMNPKSELDNYNGPQKKSFVQRHKKALIAGGIIAAVAIAAGVAYCNKNKKNKSLALVEGVDYEILGPDNPVSSFVNQMSNFKMSDFSPNSGLLMLPDLSKQHD